MKNKLFLFSLLLMIGFSPLLAQKFHYEKDEAALKALLAEVKQKDEARNKRVSDYLKKHPKESLTFKEDGNTFMIHDIEKGKPVYYTTHNSGSVASTNGDEVREGGRFGLNITGAGLRIAVWDAGTASRTHVEYQNRLLVTGGSEIDDHACHVIGTIMAGGVDPGARGYLYESVGKAYWWNNDTQEMIEEALNEDLLASNHSYGIPAGWSGGNWTGDNSISESEDYRFGFYGNSSRTVDAIAYSAPYYSIFKSAGNDRGNSGNGPFPPDGPFDCISDWGVAKNVFVIGAVQKNGGNYTGPESIVMSSFSSWGPVDDGRIKPDLVTPGVSIYSSTCEDGDDQYSNFNGTSMASPGALGATMLINESYNQFNNTYLKSASLKALMIQTAMEAGNSPGPDYSFGWGMINVEDAVDHIIAKDNINSFIREETLQDQQTFEMELNPVAGTKITATIAWTDPAGSPVSAALDPTDLMLVNDLDMRIIDELGNEVSPWTLDPAIPGKAASTGDNFRDNVEKIEFNNPQPRRYFLRVTHKGSLQSGKQDFSLVLRYTSEDPGITSLYWIGGDGNWSDQNHWSLNSGGQPANVTPGPSYKLIFDDNSFPSDEHTVTMDADYAVAGIVGINSKKITFEYSGNSLTSSGTVLLSSKNFTLSNGSLILDSPASTAQVLDLDESISSTLDLVLGSNNQATWAVNSSLLRAQSLSIQGGNLFAETSQFRIGTIEVAANAGLQINNTSIENFSSLKLDEGALWVDNVTSSLFINDENLSTVLEAPGIGIQALVQLEQGQLNINAPNANFRQIQVNQGTLELRTHLAIDLLAMEEATALQIESGSVIEVDNIDLQAATGQMIRMVGTSEGPNGVLAVTPHQKFCFDYLDILDLDLGGDASVSIGENSQIESSLNWFVGACDALLFANFEVQYACTYGITFFEDLSEGNVQAQKWFVDGSEIATGAMAEYFFAAPGTYEISLEITDGLDNFTGFTQMIEVVESDIEVNTIIQNSTQLVSLKLGDSYQWYKNYAPIPGETNRVYLYENDPAVYFVLTFVEGCNRISEVLDLGTTAVENLDENPNPAIKIFPNPVEDMIYIQSDQLFDSNINLSISNALGQVVLQRTEGSGKSMRVDVSTITPGLYILSLSVGDQVFTKKIIKNE
jgi:hypothetical protein